MMRKVAVVASSRATYGYEREIIRGIQDSTTLELQLVVTGMHLLREYGYSLSEIEADGFPIATTVEMMVGGDTPSAWAKSLGVHVQSLAQVFSMLKPDLVLIAGDRAEILATAVTAAYMNIPIAHIQAGDVSGHVDGSARHAITKLAHIHFPSCEDSARRVERLGEEPWRIHTVGAPQLDAILGPPPLSQQETSSAVGVDLRDPTLLVIQHPVLVEMRQAYGQMRETMAAIERVGIQTIVIYPNVDVGGERVVEAIREYEHLPFVHPRRNLNRNVFISLLSWVEVLVGNSSCGILEAPALKLPVVNIGNRQRGRMQADNVLNVGHHSEEIASAIRMAFGDLDFHERVAQCENPYGDGKSSARIVEIIEGLDFDARLLDKRITY